MHWRPGGAALGTGWRSIARRAFVAGCSCMSNYTQLYTLFCTCVAKTKHALKKIIVFRLHITRSDVDLPDPQFRHATDVDYFGEWNHEEATCRTVCNGPAGWIDWLRIAGSHAVPSPESLRTRALCSRTVLALRIDALWRRIRQRALHPRP